MKFLYLLPLLVGLSGAGKTKETAAPVCADCDCFTDQTSCFESNLNCMWAEKEGDCHHNPPIPGTKGGYCNMKYTTTANGRVKYTKNSGSDGVSCGSDPECGTLTCFPAEDTGVEPDNGAIIDGTCECEMCHGKADPETGLQDLDPTNEATIRVTICHRTCSKKNPWVRITIDDDAWNGTAASGCGHQQHNVTEECWNAGADTNFAEWGSHRTDYLIKWHGTREYVRKMNNWETPTCTNGGCKFDQAEKDYWFVWERACPYVRNGFCCGYGIRDGVDYGECCGDDPTPPPVVPETVTEPPTEPPTPCPVVMTHGDEVCPGLTDYHAVQMIKIQTGGIDMPTADARDLIYDIQQNPVDGTVSFKVDNPYDEPVNMYVQHNAVPQRASGQKFGAFDSNCAKMPQVPGCNPDAQTITAACVDPGNGNPPFTIVNLYFIGTNADIFGTGSGAPVEECCIDPLNPLTAEDKVIELTFEIHCECPSSITRN